MRVGDIIETEIVSNGMDGEGVAREDGKVVFIPYTLKGERVRAVVKQVKKKYAAASVVKILSPSAQRVKPDCPHYYKCGGCDMGHVSSQFRREALLCDLENNIKKIAKIDYTPREFVACDGGGACRNKLSMPFGFADGSVVLGLYRHNTHVVEPVECAMSGALARSVAQTVCKFANAARLSVYDEKSGNGLLRHLVVREISGRASVTLVVNSDRSAAWEKDLAKQLPDAVDFFISPNTRRNNVIMGESVRLVKGNAGLAVDVLGVKAELSPLSFFQVNDEIRDKLYSAAISEVQSDTLIDLYSGIGITSNLAAKKCKHIIAVECVPQAVKDADFTARLNGNAHKIKNVCGKVEGVLSELRDEIRGADVLIDPPRKGCGADVAASIAAVRPNKLIYISCNHATMCRDIRAFLDVAPEYKLADCRIFDMFPNTHHTETLAVLVKKNG